MPPQTNFYGDARSDVEPARGRPTALRPIVDLDSGAVLAIEAVPLAEKHHGADTATLSERLIRISREVMACESLLPLVLPVPARLLSAGQEPFALLESTLRRAGRRPRDITLMIGPELQRMPHEHLVKGLGHVRALGFRYALGTARISPDVLVKTAPFLFRVDSVLTSGLPGNERFSAIVDGMARIGRGAGTFPLASGVTSITQLLSLRQTGIRLAQGSLFAKDDWEPGERVNPVPDLALESSSLDLERGPRIAEFTLPAVTMADETTSEEVLEAFSNDSALNSVILIDHRERPVAAVDRMRFLLAITGPYGHALHAKRPARRLAAPPRTVLRGTPVLTALRAAGTERDRVYDDLIVTNEFGQCMGVVRVSDLIRSLSRECGQDRAGRG